MKKYLPKICIGVIAFTVFLAVGGFGASVQTTSPSAQQHNEMIKRSDTGFYTGNSNIKVKKKTPPRNSRIIYMGEPTEGLLD